MSFGDVSGISNLNFISQFILQPELIRFWGYSAEEHYVITEDGYILGMHRIPNSGPPVFLAHGLTSSSAQWVFGPPEKSLGYLLADAGYDVWMGNTRGNTYSKNHVEFDTCSRCEEFWSYCFDDSGVKDYSAEIDYILDKTGYEKLHFVGHSMGGTQYVVRFSIVFNLQQNISRHFMKDICGLFTVSCRFYCLKDLNIMTKSMRLTF